MNYNILLISRPFSKTLLGTGEQVVSREIFNALKIDGGFNIDIVNDALITSHKTILSLLYYDWVIPHVLILKAVRRNYSLVFFNSPFQASAIIFYKLLGIKTAVLVHDVFCWDYKKSFYDRYASWLYFYTLKKTDYILATTEETGVKIKNKLHLKPIIIHLGGGIFFDNLKRIKSKEASADIGYIGAYTERKRVSNFIKLIRNDTIGFRIHFAGRMPEAFASSLRDAITNPHTNIIIHGEIAEAAKVAFYNRISFLYFPTILEGFGLPILEALKTGVLPITHSDADIPLCLKSRCIIIDDPTDISQCIQKYFIHENEYIDYVRANYEYSKEYSYSNYSSKIKELCKE